MPGRTKKTQEIADDTVMDDAPTSAQPDVAQDIETGLVEEQEETAEDAAEEEEVAEPQRVRIV